MSRRTGTVTVWWIFCVTGRRSNSNDCNCLGHAGMLTRTTMYLKLAKNAGMTLFNWGLTRRIGDDTMQT